MMCDANSLKTCKCCPPVATEVFCTFSLVKIKAEIVLTGALKKQTLQTNTAAVTSSFAFVSKPHSTASRFWKLEK